MSAPKKLVAPKIRSKAATSLRYCVLPYPMPNVSCISAAEGNLTVADCWRVANVARKMGKPVLPQGKP